MNTWTNELRLLIRLSLPAIGTQVGFMLTGFVDTLMLAHVGIHELSAAGAANLLYWFIAASAMGAIQGMDPWVSQAHGAGMPKETGLALLNGLAVALLVAAPSMLVIAGSEPILLWLEQPPSTAHSAAVYNRIRLWGLPGLLLFTALRQYLQGRGQMRAPALAMWIGNGLNVAFNWVLIWGHLGLPALGLRGAAVASVLTTSLLPVLLWWGMVRSGLHEDTLPSNPFKAIDRRSIAKVLRFGFPVSLHVAVEVGSFSLAAALAGKLGVIPMAAHQILLQVAALTFMVPLGVSMAASAHVGNLVGARADHRLRQAIWVSLALGGGTMLFFGVAIVGLRFQLPLLFDARGKLLSLTAGVFPIVAAFQVADGVQAVAGGALRGLGRPQLVAWLHAGSWGLLALPLGYWLSGAGGLGLNGIWIGLASGIWVAAAGLALATLRSRPRHVA